jgi:hypothetical protein
LFADIVRQLKVALNLKDIFSLSFSRAVLEGMVDSLDICQRHIHSYQAKLLSTSTKSKNTTCG